MNRASTERRRYESRIHGVERRDKSLIYGGVRRDESRTHVVAH